MFTCAPISKRMVMKITKPKLAPSCCVKTVVWVRKPGPIADVAIRKAAPRITDLFLGSKSFVCKINFKH
jgi:hypothetical protein